MTNKNMQSNKINNLDLVHAIVNYNCPVKLPEALIEFVRLAYWMGAEEEARIRGEKMQEVFAAQKERARNCRYYNVAMKVQGNIDYIYSPNYAGDYAATFSEYINTEWLTDYDHKEEGFVNRYEEEHSDEDCIKDEDDSLPFHPQDWPEEIGA